ncbi:MAG: RNA polymerase sigma factor [Planctomycetota bacterium]
MKPTPGSADSLLEHAAFLQRLARAMLHDHDADDVVQETWLRALKSPPRNVAAARSWLSVVARRMAWRQGSQTRSRRDREASIARPERTPSTLETAERLEQERRVVDAVHRLPEPYRTTLVLRYFDGLKPRGIAVRENTPIETVRSRLQRGLRALRKDLGPDTSCALALGVIAAGPQRLVPWSGVFIMSTAQKLGAVVLAAGAVAGITIVATNTSERAPVRLDTEMVALKEENARLRERLAQKDVRIAALVRTDSAGTTHQAAGASPAAQGSSASANARAQNDPNKTGRDTRWREIQETLAPVMAILKKMQEEGANQMQLGPQMVAELGKVGIARFDDIMEFDGGENDPEVIAEIRAVMLQAFIFVPGIGKKRNSYMQRYLERTQDGTAGARASEYSLRRISYSMPPFFNGYQKIVEPLHAELRTKFVEFAIERAARGGTDSLRMDGVSFLRHVNDPRATAELMRVFADHANPLPMRAVALTGLGKSTDENVRQALQNAAATDPNEKIRAQAAQAVKAAEARANR